MLEAGSTPSAQAIGLNPRLRRATLLEHLSSGTLF